MTRYLIRKYDFHCDECGKQEELEISALEADDKLPPGWRALNDNPILGRRGEELCAFIKHFCPKCRPDLVRQ